MEISSLEDEPPETSLQKALKSKNRKIHESPIFCFYGVTGGFLLSGLVYTPNFITI